MTENQLRHALQRSLSSPLPAQTRTAVLATIREKEKPMKKKISMGLVLALIIVTLSAVAMAWSLSRQYFEDVAQLQFSSGYYDDWGLAEKQAMVGLLQEHGLITADQAAAMQDEAAIDRYMIDRYGVHGRSDVIGLTSILEKELGSMDTWTQPTWVWYSQMNADVGLLTEHNDDNYHFMPGDEAISEAEAIAAARRLLEQQHDLPEGSLDDAQTNWTYFTTAHDMHTRRYPRHGVELKTSDGHIYYCELHPDGTPWTEADDAASSPYDWEVRHMINAYAQDHHLTADLGYFGLRDFPLAHMAACIDSIRPVIEKNVAANPDYQDPLGLWFMEHFYGVPDERTLPLEQAEAIAHNALNEPATLDRLCYEITDPAAPLWKLTFQCTSTDPAMTCRVFINAYTGEVVDVIRFDPDASYSAAEGIANNY